MNSSLFNRMMAPQQSPYQRNYANIPGMQMPQMQNPSPSGRFIFPPRPQAAQPITMPPGLAPLNPNGGIPLIDPNTAGGDSGTPSGGTTGGDPAPGEGTGANW